MKKYIQNTKHVVMCFFISFFSIAQQDPQFSQYMFANMSFNPAYAGITERTEFVGIYRSQWTSNKTTLDGNTGTPVSQIISASTKLKFINSGIGLNIIHDNIATLDNIYIKLNYSYHINLSEDLKLGIGISGGYLNQSINTSLWRPSDVQTDNRLEDIKNNPSNGVLDADAGFWILSKKFSLGISTAHILQPNLFSNVIQSFEYNSSFRRHAYLYSHYKIQMNENWQLVPSVLLKSSLKALNNTQFEFTGLAVYSDYKFWGGVSYRNYDALVAMIGIGFLKNNALKVGYAFDLTVLGAAAKAGTSHEILATYSIPVKDLLPKPVIRTPRFRY